MLPLCAGLWDHVFRVNQDNWNLRAIKQDHMNEQLEFKPCSCVAGLWLFSQWGGRARARGAECACADLDQLSHCAQHTASTPVVFGM